MPRDLSRRARTIAIIASGVMFAALSGCNSHWTLDLNDGRCGSTYDSCTSGGDALFFLGVFAIAEGLRLIFSRGCR